MVLKNKGYVFRDLITIYGKIRYRRTMLAPVDAESAAALACIQKAKYVCPLDCILKVDNLPFKITVKMMAAIAKEAVRSTSYERAAATILEHYKVNINTATVRLVTDYVGTVVYNDDKRRATEAEENLKVPFDRRRKRRRRFDDTLFIEMDGAMVNTRVTLDGTSWTECKVGLAFHSKDRHVWRNASGDIRSRILKKRIVGYIGNCDVFKYHLLAIARDYSYQQCSQIVVISDGATWIQRIVEELFPEAIHILDLFHVKEHVHEFGKCVIHDDEQAAEWIDQINTMIEESKTDQVLDTLEQYKDFKCPANVSNLYTYIYNHKDCMDYKKYKELNLYVGSGAIESANKYTMQNRMKLQGMRWNPETAQGVLSLKARLESDRWHEVESLLQEHFDDPKLVNGI